MRYEVPLDTLEDTANEHGDPDFKFEYSKDSNEKFWLNVKRKSNDKTM